MENDRRMTVRDAALAELYERIERLTSPVYARYDWWPCEINCSDSCCHRSAFLVSATEFVFITESMLEMTRDERRAIFARAHSELSRFHQRVGYGAWKDLCSLHNQHELTCPLFDQAGGKCMIYEARPLVCRIYGAVALTDGRKRPYGCRKVAGAMTKAITEGTDVVLPDFAVVEKMMAGVLVAPLKPLAAWLGETR